VRVAVAMSGGVDSSVAAALLVKDGHAVQGLSMRLWREPAAEGSAEESLPAARAVCAHLDIPHEVVDLREEFLQEVVGYFIQEYAQGRTPNPCLRCNRLLKFGLLLDQAQKLGCEFLATGHYARVRRCGEEYHLLCGLDPTKDQSYVLYALQQPQLRRVLFPLGERTKADVRRLAAEWGLPISARPESQDACFIADHDYRRFLAERLPEALHPGPILDRQGRLLGEHKGLPFYTVGQREGLGISAPRPLYVLGLDVARNALVVGFAEELGRDALLAEEMSYVASREPRAGLAIEAKIRYRAGRVPATLMPLPAGRARIKFARPLRDITPGQAVVLYQGEELLGGGIIEG